MRTRQCLFGAALLDGCGAVFHGSSQTVTFKSRPEEKIVVYHDGVPLPSTAPGTYTANAFLADNGGFVPVASGKKAKRVVPEKNVDGLAIGLDGLWCLTIIGVAEPISDLLLGTFVALDDEMDVSSRRAELAG